MSPYRENNTLKVTVLGLPPTKGYYRFSLQPIDDHGPSDRAEVLGESGFLPRAFRRVVRRRRFLFPAMP